MEFKCFKFWLKNISIFLSNISTSDLHLFYHIQKILISSITDEKKDFQVDGYTVNGLVYTVYSISLWFAPAAISLAGLRMAMVYSATGFT